MTFDRAETDANNLVSPRPAYLQLPKHVGSVLRIEKDCHIHFLSTGLPLLSRLRHSLSFVKPGLPDLYCASFLNFHELLRSVYSMSDEVLFSPLSTSNSARPFPHLICPVLTICKGASPRELLLEASRRNNTSLLTELLSSLSSPEKTAHLLNTATDGVGNYCLHIAASYGSCTSYLYSS